MVSSTRTPSPRSTGSDQCTAKAFAYDQIAIAAVATPTARILVRRAPAATCGVGGGAMGVVWHARDTVLDRDVALKELLILAEMTEEQTDEAQRRAMREARIAARLHHPHAITVYDVIEHEGRPALIMEYLPSRS